MSFYAQAATTALRLISQFGADIVAHRVTNNYDPVFGASIERTSERQTLKALILPVATTPKGLMTEADNKFIADLVTGKIRFALAAAKGATFEPKAGDVVVSGGEGYTVVGCSPLSPAGIPILYKMALEVGASLNLTPVTWQGFTGLAWRDLTDTPWEELVSPITNENAWAAFASTGWDDMGSTTWQQLN